MYRWRSVPEGKCPREIEMLEVMSVLVKVQQYDQHGHLLGGDDSENDVFRWMLILC